MISAYNRRKNKGSNDFLDQKFPKGMTHKINGVTIASCGTATLIKRTLLFCRRVCASFPLRPRGSCFKDSLISWQSAAEAYINALMELLAAIEYWFPPPLYCCPATLSRSDDGKGKPGTEAKRMRAIVRRNVPVPPNIASFCLEFLGHHCTIWVHTKKSSLRIPLAHYLQLNCMRALLLVMGDRFLQKQMPSFAVLKRSSHCSFILTLPEQHMSCLLGFKNREGCKNKNEAI